MIYHLVESLKGPLEETGLIRILQVVFQVEFRAFLAVLVSFGLVLAFGRPVIRWLLRQKVGDSPEFHNADLNDLMRSRAGTPTMGGILICGSILITILLLAELRSRYIHLAIAVLVAYSVLGMFDDWLKLTSARRTPGSRDGLLPWEKLLFQLGLAHHRIEPGTEMACHSARFPHPFPDKAHRLGEVLGADHHQGHHHDEQQLGGRNVKHELKLPPQADDGQSLSCSAVGVGIASGARWPSICLGAGVVGPSSSDMPFLKLLIPLATSPIMSEKRPLPNRSRTRIPTTSQCQMLKLPILNSP